MLVPFARGIIWLVALFYVYGASVHMMNIFSLTGYEWFNAPIKWQILDIVYLSLDLVVAIGFVAQWKISVVAFYLASISQIALYTLFHSWILDVAQDFAVSTEQVSSLNALVLFHIVTLILVTIALRII